MRKIRKKLISLLLALSMVLSLCANGALAAQSEPEADVSAQALADASDQSGAAQSEPEGDVSRNGETTSEAETSRSGESAPEAETSRSGESASEEETSRMEESEPETESAQSEQSAPQADEPLNEEDAQTAQQDEATESTEELAAEEEPQAILNIARTDALSLEYDDRFTFSQGAEGYVVAQIKDQNPTSFQVSRGKTTATKDKAVITLNNAGGTAGVATGTGTATVIMVKQADLVAARKLIEDPANATQSVDAIQVNVEVRPAVLTLMFLAGQSNMEGWGSDTGLGKSKAKYFQHPEDSVVCPEGEVYSTYAPGSTAWKHARADSIGGNVNFKYYCTKDRAEKFVAESLTSDASVDGTALVYKLNQLTAKGSGKNGPDSGMAYEWNRLTGEKVWTVNAAVGSSSIKQWTPGQSCYVRARAIFGNALNVYNAEISAGHYTQGHKFYFWLQGEADRNMSASKYLNKFRLMHQYMSQSLGYEKLGIITVRASTNSKYYRDARDLVMTGPRISQTSMGNSGTMPEVHVVSDVNENWVTDKGVRNYFSQVYGSALSYQTHSGSLSLPTKVSQVHNDIHYLQVGHNENGITAARGMFEVLNGSTASWVRWRTADGKSVSGLSMAKGDAVVLSPAVSAVSASKGVKYRLSAGLSYSSASGKLKMNQGGSQKIEALAPDGTVISTLSVTGGGVGAPTLKSVKNVSGKKLKASWKAVKGASRYQVQCSLTSNFSSSVKSASTKSKAVTVKGLKSGKTYYVRVRAKSKKGYSSWSGSKSVTIKK